MRLYHGKMVVGATAIYPKVLESLLKVSNELYSLQVN